MDTSPDPAKVLEPISETAKAVQEASKFGTEVTRTVAGGGRWLDGVLGEGTVARVDQLETAATVTPTAG
jgi:hypothetical protein